MIFLPEKDLIEKDTTMKTFHYSLLGKELKKQTSVAERQYKKLDNVFESDKKEKDKIKNERSCAKSSLVYNNYFPSYKYHNLEEFAKGFFDSKRNDLKEFKDKLELFYQDTLEIKPNNEYQIRDFERLKLLTPNKLLTRLPILLPQIKPRNNSNKLTKTNTMFCISTIKSPKKFTTV